MRLPWASQPFTPGGVFSIGTRDISYADGDILAPDKHLAGRLFYPCPPNSRTWGTPVTWWMPHVNYAYGYANYAFWWARDKGLKWKVAQSLAQCVIQIMGTWYELPVAYNAPLQPVPGRGQGASPAGSAQETPRPQAPAPLDPGGSGSAGHNGYPVVIFSHGLAGNRNTYSSICCELASQGCVVLALEHADGTASTARLARRMRGSKDMPGVQGGWRYYKGMGSWQAEITTAKTVWRAQEVDLAVQLLQELAQGQQREGVTITGPTGGTGQAQGQLPGSFLQGKLDLSRVLLVGHSWGGATVALAASQNPAVSGAVALDPWWDAVPAQSPTFTGWATRAPLLVIGSHTWNTPSPSTGRLACGAGQEDVLASAARGRGDPAGGDGRQPQGGGAAGAGPGALLLVPKDSAHSSFDDIGLYFGGLAAAMLKFFPSYLRFSTKLPQEQSLDITCSVILTFMHDHMHCSFPGAGADSTNSSSAASHTTTTTSNNKGAAPATNGLHPSASGMQPRQPASAPPCTLPVTGRLVRQWRQALPAAVQPAQVTAFADGHAQRFLAAWPDDTFAIVREYVPGKPAGTAA